MDFTDIIKNLCWRFHRFEATIRGGEAIRLRARSTVAALVIVGASETKAGSA
jgi:hypothetical protein